MHEREAGSHHSKGVHIRLGGAGQAQQHFWSRPAEGANVTGGHVGRQVVIVVLRQRLAQPHICHLGTIVLVQQDVGALEAAPDRVPSALDPRADCFFRHEHPCRQT